MICVGTQPFVRVGWVQKQKDREQRGEGGMMSSQVGAGSGPGPVVAGMVLPLGFGAGKDRWRWNDVEYGEQECVIQYVCIWMCLFLFWVCTKLSVCVCGFASLCAKACGRKSIGCFMLRSLFVSVFL